MLNELDDAKHPLSIINTTLGSYYHQIHKVHLDRRIDFNKTTHFNRQATR